MRPSEMAQAAVTLALNVSSSKALCKALELKHNPVARSRAGALDWWSERDAALTLVNREALPVNYGRLVTEVDSKIFQGKLRLDQSIWSY